MLAAPEQLAVDDERGDAEDPGNETGGTGRYWDFRIEQVLQIEGSLAGATEFLDYSPHNPSPNA